MPAFDELDKTETITKDLLKQVKEIIVRRNDSLPGVPLELIVVWNNAGQVESRRVDSTTVDAAWPGASKSFKAHLFAIISAAGF